VRAPRAGSVDRDLWFNSATGSLRIQQQEGSLRLAARVSYYDEARGAGLLGVSSAAKGWNGSLSASDLNDAGNEGWRVQVWTMATDFSNSSASVPAFPAPRNSIRPANNQYATPALGLRWQCRSSRRKRRVSLAGGWRSPVECGRVARIFFLRGSHGNFPDAQACGWKADGCGSVRRDCL
jgi:hypothetical protein